MRRPPAAQRCLPLAVMGTKERGGVSTAPPVRKNVLGQPCKMSESANVDEVKLIVSTLLLPIAFAVAELLT